MYLPGHVGIALVLYAPVGLYLLTRRRTRLAIAGVSIVAGATLLPDVDVWLPWFVHRGRTHTLWFALCTGVSFGAIAAFVGGYRNRTSASVLVSGSFGVTVGTLAILGHLLGDVITPMGVRPLYPLSDATYTLELVLASDPTANARLFALGCLATVAQVFLGVAPTASGRSTLREALIIAARYVRDGPRASRVARGGPGESSNRLTSAFRRVRKRTTVRGLLSRGASRPTVGEHSTPADD